MVGEREGSVVDEGPQPNRDTSQQMAAPSRLPPSASRPPVRCQLMVKGKLLSSKASRSSNEDRRRNPPMQDEELAKKDGGLWRVVMTPLLCSLLSCVNVAMLGYPGGLVANESLSDLWKIQRGNYILEPARLFWRHGPLLM